MTDITQEYGKYGAKKQIEIYCKICEGSKQHFYIGIQKDVPEDLKPFFVYNCVTCFGTKSVYPDDSQLEKILIEAKA